MAGIQVQPCCCTPGHSDPPGSDACETNCIGGTIPNSFELVMPSGAFNTFIGCGAACATFAGTFLLEWYGSVGGICRWTYCFDPDPCNPGMAAMYVFSYRTPNVAVLILAYNLTDCNDTAWVNWNEWDNTVGAAGGVGSPAADCLFDVFASPVFLNWNLDAATPNCAIFDGTDPPTNDGRNPSIQAIN